MSCCKKTCCCSCNPIIPIYEYEIPSGILVTSQNLKIPINQNTDISLLKDKVVCEYFLIISQLEKGKRPDLEFLLEEISAIDIEQEIDNREFILQYYLNNKL